MNRSPGLEALLLIMMLLVAPSCDRSAEPQQTQQPPRLVKTLTITTPAQGFWRELPGVVDAAQKADLGFRVPGKLEKLLVSEGEMVSSGQLLAQLDATDQRIQLNSRQAEYNQAKADFERAQALIKKNLIARSDYNKLEAQEAVARANLSAARQNLDYTLLRAPFAGRIARRYVDNFEEVSAKQAVYALYDPSSMTIRVDVPASVMINVRRGAKPKVDAIFDAIPGKQFPLSMKEVSTQANKDTNTFQVTFSMPAIEEYNVLAGMSVTVRGERDPAVLPENGYFYVPAHAVLEDAEGRYVYVVKASGSAPDNALGTVQRRAVQIGRLSNQGMEIIAGLRESDKVVTAGMSKMHDGLEVRLGGEQLN